jgi:hypothetical protein
MFAESKGKTNFGMPGFINAMTRGGGIGNNQQRTTLL